MVIILFFRGRVGPAPTPAGPAPTLASPAPTLAARALAPQPQL